MRRCGGVSSRPYGLTPSGMEYEVRFPAPIGQFYIIIPTSGLSLLGIRQEVFASINAHHCTREKLAEMIKETKIERIDTTSRKSGVIFGIDHAVTVCVDDASITADEMRYLAVMIFGADTTAQNRSGLWLLRIAGNPVYLPGSGTYEKTYAELVERCGSPELTPPDIISLADQAARRCGGEIDAVDLNESVVSFVMDCDDVMEDITVDFETDCSVLDVRRGVIAAFNAARSHDYTVVTLYGVDQNGAGDMETVELRTAAEVLRTVPSADAVWRAYADHLDMAVHKLYGLAGVPCPSDNAGLFTAPEVLRNSCGLSFDEWLDAAGITRAGVNAFALNGMLQAWGAGEDPTEHKATGVEGVLVNAESGWSAHATRSGRLSAKTANFVGTSFGYTYETTTDRDRARGKYGCEDGLPAVASMTYLDPPRGCESCGNVMLKSERFTCGFCKHVHPMVRR